MLSTTLEIAGLAALAAGAFLIAGLVALLIVGGAELLLLGLALEGGVPRRGAKRK